MSPSAAATDAASRPPGADRSTQQNRRLRIADVALFYGPRSGGIRTYLNAKADYAESSGAFEHHLLVPGASERHERGRHELPSLAFSRANGYRLPLGTRALKRTLRAIRPDIVLLHDPFWSPRGAARLAHELGARVVAVQHGTSELYATVAPAPTRLLAPLLRRWLRRAYGSADAVLAASPVDSDLWHGQAIRLRLGLDQAFRPSPEVERGAHVLYVGRLAREKGVFELLEAAAQRAWPLTLIGAGPAKATLETNARRLRLSDRLVIKPFLADRAELARAYAAAACVVVPGELELGPFVALEAIASGASVVVCANNAAAALLGSRLETFTPRTAGALAAAIERARRREPDYAAAVELATQLSWPRVFAAELDDLARLLR